MIAKTCSFYSTPPALRALKPLMALMPMGGWQNCYYHYPQAGMEWFWELFWMTFRF